MTVLIHAANNLEQTKSEKYASLETFFCNTCVQGTPSFKDFWNKAWSPLRKTFLTWKISITYTREPTLSKRRHFLDFQGTFQNEEPIVFHTRTYLNCGHFLVMHLSIQSFNIPSPSPTSTSMASDCHSCLAVGEVEPCLIEVGNLYWECQVFQAEYKCYI